MEEEADIYIALKERRKLLSVINVFDETNMQSLSSVFSPSCAFLTFNNPERHHRLLAGCLCNGCPKRHDNLLQWCHCAHHARYRQFNGHWHRDRGALLAEEWHEVRAQDLEAGSAPLLCCGLLYWCANISCAVCHHAWDNLVGGASLSVCIFPKSKPLEKNKVLNRLVCLASFISFPFKLSFVYLYQEVA